MKRVLLALGIAVAVAATLVPPGAAAAPASLGSPAQFEAGVVARINAVRARSGLRPLRVSRELASAARHHAGDMARSGFCGHDSADGSPFRGRLLRFYARRPGWRLWSAAENVICHARGLTAATAVALWLDSPGHRANILSPTWREVGVASVYGRSTAGELLFVTADFGVRR
jgi:uncharacterized protein YkwD